MVPRNGLQHSEMKYRTSFYSIQGGRLWTSRTFSQGLGWISCLKQAHRSLHMGGKKSAVTKVFSPFVKWEIIGRETGTRRFPIFLVAKQKSTWTLYPEADIQVRHLKNFLKERVCGYVCVFPHNLIVTMHFCAPLAICLSSLKHYSLALLLPVYPAHPALPPPSCEILQGSVRVFHPCILVLSAGPDP